MPYRLTSIDLRNEWGGNVTIAWTVDQLKVRDGVAYFAFTKIGMSLLGPPEELWIMVMPSEHSAPLCTVSPLLHSSRVPRPLPRAPACAIAPLATAR